MNPEPLRGKILGEILSEEKIMPSGIIIVPKENLKRGTDPKRVKVIAIGKPNYKKKAYSVAVPARDGRGTETQHRITKFKLEKKNGKPIEQERHYKEGDIIYIRKGAGVPVWINQKRHLFLKRGDILGVE